MMANPRIAWNNLIDQAGVVITESSEAVTLPSENVANAQRTKPWQTGVAATDEWVVFDFGSAKAFGCVILLDHDLTASDSAIKLEANATDSWGAPSVTKTLTRVAGPIVAWFPDESYRFCRVSFTKSAAAETRQIGRIFIGEYYSDSILSALDITPIDTSLSSQSIGGQDYSDIRAQHDDIKFNFDLIASAEKDQLKTMVDSVGKHTPFFVSINHDVEPVDWVYYVKLKSLAALSPVSSLNYWQTTLSLKEQL